MPHLLDLHLVRDLFYGIGLEQLAALARAEFIHVDVIEAFLPFVVVLGRAPLKEAPAPKS